jgi:glycerol uptake facilitator protein
MLDNLFEIFRGEFLGLVVFVVVHGGILASMALTGKVKEGMAALAVFLGISFGVFAAIAGGSGAHINPAVTAAVFVTGGIDAVEALVYIGSQILGGFVGGLILWVIYRPQFKAATNPLAPLTGNPDQKDLTQNLITSFLGSFLLALLVLVTVSQTTNPLGIEAIRDGLEPISDFFAITPLAVGAAVLAAALAVGGTAYSVLNVARDLGPRLTATVLKIGQPTWVPVLLLTLASLAGGALAGFVVTLIG